MSYRDMLAGLGPPPIKLGEKVTSLTPSWYGQPIYSGYEALGIDRSEVEDAIRRAWIASTTSELEPK